MFCASESATAICKTSLEHSSPTTIHLGGSASATARAIDRHNPIIHASRRSISSLKKPERKSSASLVDAVRKNSCIKPSAFFSPPPSSKTHQPLGKSQSCNQLPHSPDKKLALDQTGEKGLDLKTRSGKLVKSSSLKNDATPLFVPPSDKFYYSPFRINSNQVVVVRVSLHCKGCAGKVKKYISKMQGITSFNVDFDAKKVTVVGNVTPLEVLASITKVRTAQLLPPEKPNLMLSVVQKRESLFE